MQVRPRRRATQCRRRFDDVMMLLMLTALIEQQPLQEDDRHDRHSQRVDVEDLSATTSSSLPQTVLTSDSVAVFKLRLKTFLFSQAFSSFSAHYHARCLAPAPLKLRHYGAIQICLLLLLLLLLLSCRHYHHHADAAYCYRCSEVCVSLCVS